MEKQTTVKLKEGFGNPKTRKGLNATTIVGNTKIVIPKGKIVTKYFNEDGKEEKAYNHKKEEFDQKLDDAISDMSGKADDIITALENKLEELKRKNAHLQKN